MSLVYAHPLLDEINIDEPLLIIPPLCGTSSRSVERERRSKGHGNLREYTRDWGPCRDRSKLCVVLLCRGVGKGGEGWEKQKEVGCHYLYYSDVFLL